MPEPKFKIPFSLPQFKPAGEGTGEDKKRLYILMGLLVVLIAIALGVNFYLNQEPPSAQSPVDPNIAEQKMEEDLAQILPLLKREEDEKLAFPSKILQQEGMDPFGTPIELVGILLGDDDLAIVKAQQTSYILAVGDKIAEFWELIEINKNSVVFKNNTKEILVELSPRK